MKRIISFLLAALICLSLSPVVFAAEVYTVEEKDSLYLSDQGESTRAEETMWYFRTVNGMMQMRLWSLTYRKWLTDWIDIGPAP